ncbi:PRP38 family-domain-containing protein [Nemania sp. FL0916]|nr:PRP38 family-domain-containing protein [Nemania sp. FL0916]
MPPSDTHRADERRFLDERGSASATLAPNGLNPATIMEKAVRERIIGSYFWKEQCFGVNEADIIDRVASHVKFVGGTYGVSQTPSPFLCLAFKLLQLSPGDDVLGVYLEYGGEKWKYLRALACFYVRLTRKAEDVHKVLEGYLGDRRKLRRRGREGVRVGYVDEFVDELLVKERVCGTSLWQMPKREILEDLEVLEPRVSPLGDIEELLAEEEEEEENREGEGDGGDEEGGERRRENGARSGGDREEGETESEDDREREYRRRRRSSSEYSDRDYRRRRSSSQRDSSGDRMDVDRDDRDHRSRRERSDSR